MISLLRKAFALHPPPALRLRLLRWMAASAAREFAWALLAATLALIAILVAFGAAGATAGIVAVVALAGFALWLARLAWQSLNSARGVREALAELEPPADEERSDFPLSHLLFPPLMLWPRGVSHVRGVEFARYGDRALRLDVYQPRAPAAGLRPAIVQVHGGGWVVGTRAEQGIPLLNHLANHGWVGFNIDYRLSPRATFPDHLVDVKRAISWVREHAAEYGADPDLICLTGGSAGGHLCALAALTADDPSLQAGFEDADTSVAAAVPFYGVYDFRDRTGIRGRQSMVDLMAKYVFQCRPEQNPELWDALSPLARVSADAPPFLVVQGTHDTLVFVEEAREFVRALREKSQSPVHYLEMKGGQHAFEIFHSVRSQYAVRAATAFLEGEHAKYRAAQAA